MKHYFYLPAVLLAGVISALVLFTLLVFISNLNLHQNLSALEDAGYLIVPNAAIMPSLQKLTPAVCGGLFFALTAGAGLSLTGFFVVLLGRRFSGQYPVLLILLLCAVVFFAFKLRFDFPAALGGILTFAVAGFFAHRFFPGKDLPPLPLFRLLAGHFTAIAIIVFIWMPVLNKDIFISIRDTLLLTNPVGKAVNNFYYTYTLYPAETFKSLDQKLLKSCSITGDARDLHPEVLAHLIDKDYLPVETEVDPDITINHDSGQLVFLQHGKQIYMCSSDKFLKKHESILELISEKTDDRAFLRKITFLSLIIASPILLYILMHAFFMLVFSFFKSQSIRLASAFICCLVIFSLPAVLFYLDPGNTLAQTDISKYLQSENPRDRVAALKTISDQNLRVDRYIDPWIIAQSNDTVERYWLAKTLGSLRSPESYQLILKLLDDPQPNVVCMAFYSLGKQKNKNAAGEIIRRIENSGHWYAQWYAYKALKRLKWTQAKLKH